MCPSKIKSVGRSPGVTNYTKEKIDILLRIVERSLPVSTPEWEAACREYNQQSGDDRDAECIRRKFRDIANLKKYSTSTTADQIEVAKAVYCRIRERFSVLTQSEQKDNEEAMRALLPQQMQSDQRQQDSGVDENGSPVEQALDGMMMQQNDASGLKPFKKYKGGMPRLSDPRMREIATGPIGISNNHVLALSQQPTETAVNNNQLTNNNNNTNNPSNNNNNSNNITVSGSFLNQLSEQMMMMFTMMQQQAQAQQQQFMTMMQQQNVLLAAVLSESQARKRKAEGDLLVTDHDTNSVDRLNSNPNSSNGGSSSNMLHHEGSLGGSLGVDLLRPMHHIHDLMGADRAVMDHSLSGLADMSHGLHSDPTGKLDNNNNNNNSGSSHHHHDANHMVSLL